MVTYKMYRNSLNITTMTPVSFPEIIPRRKLDILTNIDLFTAEKVCIVTIALNSVDFWVILNIR